MAKPDSSESTSTPQAKHKTTPKQPADSSQSASRASNHEDDTSSTLHDISKRPDLENFKPSDFKHRSGYVSIEASVDQASVQAFAHTRRPNSARERRSRVNTHWQAIRQCYEHPMPSPHISDGKDEWSGVETLVEHGQSGGSAPEVDELSSERQQASMEQEQESGKRT